MARNGGGSYVSIRTKIILMVAGTLLLALTATTYLIRQFVTRYIINQKLTTTEILTTSVLHDIKFELDKSNRHSGQDIVAKYMTYYRIITNMSIFDTSGVRTAASDPKKLHKTSDDFHVADALTRAKPSLYVSQFDSETLAIRSVAPILRGTNIVGAILLDVSIQDVQLILSAIDRNIAMIMGIKLIIVCLILFFLLRGTILLRLGRLMDVTRQITAGNYDIQVEDRRRDEIGRLAEAFNRMTSDLQLSKQQIENYNKHLEERVQEATARLQQAYEDLKSTQSQLVLNEKMASLGVLISGVAHEINTPVGAILNVSRNLERKVRSLPTDLAEFKRDPRVPVDDLVACLQSLIEASCAPQPAASYRRGLAVESLLREHGIPDEHQKATTLCKLNFTDPELIARYVGCFRVPSFFAFAESFASIAQAAKISETSSQKIAEIVRALKYYAYSDKDRVESIQLNESIQTALVLLRNQLKHSVNVSTELDPELPRIPCTSEIHQVWTNLLTNAWHAVEERGGDQPGEIRISTRRDPNGVVVAVTDNGTGIPADKLDKIFDPFFTTKDIGKGTGLGLAIVSGIVKKHNGTVRVESRPGCTTFEIALPVDAASRPAAEPGARAGGRPTGSAEPAEHAA